jgi:hypothetical protein
MRVAVGPVGAAVEGEDWVAVGGEEQRKMSRDGWRLSAARWARCSGASAKGQRRVMPRAWMACQTNRWGRTTPKEPHECNRRLQ